MLRRQKNHENLKLKILYVVRYKSNAQDVVANVERNAKKNQKLEAIFLFL